MKHKSNSNHFIRRKKNRILKIMKITVFLFFTCVFSLFAGGSYSQQLLPPMDLKNVTLNQVFSKIEKESNYVFLFTDDASAELNKKINIKTDWENISDIVEEILKNTDLSYIITERQVAIYKKGKKEDSRPKAIENLFLTVSQNQQPIKISGTVKDEKGELLPGVTIFLKSNRRIANFTDVDGKFIFTGLKAGDQLVFSFIGMEPTEITIKQGQTAYNVVMKYTESQLKEVIVETGMFQRDKATFTGSTATYSADEIKAIGNQNIVQSLKTLDPSFIVLDNMAMGSDPNTMPSIVLRGGGSSTLNAIQDEFSKDPNMPLFIINGVESKIERVVGLDVSRVESVTLLKDAGSTAIYGSRGANGVVVIELIKPKPGELRVYYNGDFNIDAPDLGVFNMMNAAEKLEFERLAGKYTDTRHFVPGFQKSLNNLYNQRLADVQRGVDTYWLSEPIRTGFTHGHSVRVNGGNKDLSVDVGAKYKNQDAVMKGGGRESWSGDMSVAYRTEKLLVSNFLEVSGYDAKVSPYGDYSIWVNANPYFKKRNDEGGIDRYLETKEYYSSITNNIPNPLYNAMLNSRNNTNSLTVMNSLVVQYMPINNLRLKAGLDLTRIQDKMDKFTPPENTKYDLVSKEEQGEYYEKNTKEMAYKGYLDGSYTANINKHSLTFIARGELRQTKGEMTDFAAEGFPYGTQGTPDQAVSYRVNSKPGYFYSDERGVSFISAFNYNYDKRYLFDFTCNVDGATTFGSNELYKTFWSVGLGWNIDQEPFLKDNSWIDILKIRASTGTNGNQEQGTTFSKNVYIYSLYSNYFDQGVYLDIFANPDLPWQVKRKNSVGLDFRANKGQYSAIIDFYDEKTDPSIIRVPQVPSTGVSVYDMDLGYITSKGVDFKFVASPIFNQKDNIIAQIILMGAYNKRKYGGFGSIVDQLNAEQIKSNTLDRYKDGENPDAIWAVRSYGIDPATGEEIYIKKNGELTMEYSADDQVVVGNTSPDLQGIIGANFRYKNFFVQANLRYAFGGDIYNTALFNKVENITRSALEYNQDKRALYDRWKQPGDIAMFKAIGDIDRSTATMRTSRFVQKNNYLKGESITFSYELSNNPWIRKNLGAQYIKFSAYLNNIFWLETSKTERGTTVPFSRTISFGLNLSF